MNAAHYESIDATLLLTSEARERAEGAARLIAGTEEPAHLVAALEETDRELLALHRRLFERTYLRSGDAPEQLELSALQS